MGGISSQSAGHGHPDKCGGLCPKHRVTQQQPGRTGFRLSVQPKDHLAANRYDSLI